MDLPGELDVTVMHLHIARGNRKDRDNGPLGLAITETLRALGVPVRKVRVREEDVVIYVTGWRHHVARYWLDDDAWKIVHRFENGQVIKARTVTLSSIYIDRNR